MNGRAVGFKDTFDVGFVVTGFLLGEAVTGALLGEFVGWRTNQVRRYTQVGRRPSNEIIHTLFVTGDDVGFEVMGFLLGEAVTGWGVGLRDGALDGFEVGGGVRGALLGVFVGLHET